MNRGWIWSALTIALGIAALAAWETQRGEAASGEKRVALVIGNSEYANAGRLTNPVNDAKDVAAALGRLGFDVTPVLNSTGSHMIDAVEGFFARAQGANVAFFYYAGHGLQYEGAPYLVPVDAKLQSEMAIRRETVAAQDIVSRLENSARASVVVLDACRNNPLAEQLQRNLTGHGRAVVGRGLGRLEAASGNTLLVYSAGPGQIANDGAGRNSPFTAAFLKHVETPGLEIEQMLKRVTAEVEGGTGGEQRPERLSRLKIELLLKPGDASGGVDAKTSDKVAALEAELAKLRAKVEQQKPSPASSNPEAPTSWWPWSKPPKPDSGQQTAMAPPPAKPPVESTVKPTVGIWPEQSGPKVGETFRDCPDCPEMIVVPAGSFTMGSPAEESERFDNEGPQHKVTIARPFAVGKYAVTFAEWDACVADGGCGGYKPSDNGWGRGDRPVINVSWDDAQSYVQWLSKKTGKAYRLPSEAEREYFTRAGTSTPYWWGDSTSSDQANYGSNRYQTVPVQSFKPNPWGLYQVHGNVWEWCADHWHGGYKGAPTDGSAWIDHDATTATSRVIRGGSWLNDARRVRAASRYRNAPSDRHGHLGFRCARVQS